MIITNNGTIIHTSDNTRTLEYWQSEETNGVVQFEPAYPAIALPGGTAVRTTFESAGGIRDITLLTNTPLKCICDSSWLSVKFTESNSDTVSLNNLLSNSQITRGKLSLFSSEIWTTFGVTLRAEAGVYNTINGLRSATVSFYTSDGSTGLLTPPRGNVYFTLGFTQKGVTGGTADDGTLRLTVNGGSGYNVITVNFELRKSSASGPQFIYDSRTNPNPTTYQVAPGTYNTYLVSVSGQRGTAVSEMLSGRFDKSSITITSNKTTDLRLTIQ